MIRRISCKIALRGHVCEVMGINRSSFYYWKKHLSDPSERTRNLVKNIQLFQEYHLKYPSHGYRWLNAKIKLDKDINGLEDLLELKKQHPEIKMVLHSDQGSVYASKDYNDLLPMYVTRSMSRAGTPTDNAAMESINGWMKAEMFIDLKPEA